MKSFDCEYLIYDLDDFDLVGFEFDLIICKYSCHMSLCFSLHERTNYTVRSTKHI